MTTPSVCVGCTWARWDAAFVNRGTCAHPIIAAIPPYAERPSPLVLATGNIYADSANGFTHCPTREDSHAGGVLREAATCARSS